MLQQISEIINLILNETSKNQCVVDAETAISTSQYFGQVKTILLYLGFNVKSMTSKQISITFASLADIIVIVDAKTGEHYYATASINSNKDFALRMLPRTDDINMDKSQKIIDGCTIDSIKEYLSKGKYKLIKLIPEETHKYSSFYYSVSSMNPYPALKTEKIYMMRELVNKYNILTSSLIRNFDTVITKDGSLTCTASPMYTRNSKINVNPACCKVFAKDIDNTLIDFNIWDVTEYSVYERNDLITKLQHGIYSVKCGKIDVNITLNPDYIQMYFGSDYIKVESIGVRMRMAFEEMLTNTASVDLLYYMKKYFFYAEDSMKNIQTFNDLYVYLQSNFSAQHLGQYTDKIHPRILCPANSILSGHRSLYYTMKSDSQIDMKSVNPDDVLPSLYYIGIISQSKGYSVVQLNALSASNAEDRIKALFKDNFNEIITEVCAVYSDKKKAYEKGNYLYSFSTDIQIKLLDYISEGFKSSYAGYSEILRRICTNEGIKFTVTDDMIMYLFANNIALSAKGKKLCLTLVSSHLVKFLNLLKTGKEATEECLTKHLVSLRKTQLQGDYNKLETMISNDYSIEDIEKEFKVETTTKGFNCYTEHGILLVDVSQAKKLRLSKTAVVFHNNKELANVRFK